MLFNDLELTEKCSILQAKFYTKAITLEEYRLQTRAIFKEYFSKDDSRYDKLNEVTK